MEKAAFIIYLVVLILSPLLFGAVHTYAYTFMAVSIFMATLLLVKKQIKRDVMGGGYQLQVPNSGLNLAFYLILAVLVIQMIPLRGWIVELISFEAGYVAQKSLPATEVVANGIQGGNWFTLAPYFYPIRMSMIRFTAYGLFFFGLTQLLNSQRRIELTMTLILILGSFETLYGLVQTFSGTRQIWWFLSITDPKALTGTYINRNHFAGLMELTLLLAVSYAAALSDRNRNNESFFGGNHNFRAKISHLLSGGEKFNKRLLILFTGVVMGIGLIFSASRGGMVAAAGGLLCMGLFLIFRKGYGKKGLILLILFVVTAGYALSIGVEYPLERFKHFYSDMETRNRYAKKTMAVFSDYPITGVGIGNFQYAYPRYQSSQDQKQFFRYAHNDWAQFLAEAGAFGICALFVGMGYYVYRTVVLWRMRKDPFAICLGITPFAAVTAMGIHSFSDFNLHIPANFLMFTAVLAVGHSALHLERHRGRERSLIRYHSMPFRYRGLVTLCLLFGFIFINGYWAIRHFASESLCNSVHNSTLNRDQDPSLDEIQKAINWDGSNAEYWYKKAMRLIRNKEYRVEDHGVTPSRRPGEEDRYSLSVLGEKGHNDGLRERIAALEMAARLNPYTTEYHLRLAWAYASLWNDRKYRETYLPAADLSMERAAYFSGEKDPNQHYNMGNYWIMRSKTVIPSDPEWDVVWASARWHYRKAQRLEGTQKLKERIRRYMWKFYPDETMVDEMIIE